jgi:hypothetical protein
MKEISKWLVFCIHKLLYMECLHNPRRLVIGARRGGWLISTHKRSLTSWYSCMRLHGPQQQDVVKSRHPFRSMPFLSLTFRRWRHRRTMERQHGASVHHMQHCERLLSSPYQKVIDIPESCNSCFRRHFRSEEVVICDYKQCTARRSQGDLPSMSPAFSC